MKIFANEQRSILSYFCGFKSILSVVDVYNAFDAVTREHIDSFKVWNVNNSIHIANDTLPNRHCINFFIFFFTNNSKLTLYRYKYNKMLSNFAV